MPPAYELFPSDLDFMTKNRILTMKWTVPPFTDEELDLIEARVRETGLRDALR